MTLSEKALENKRTYNARYKAEKIKRIPLDVQLSKYEEIKVAAASVEESVNGFIKKAIDDRIDSLHPDE